VLVEDVLHNKALLKEELVAERAAPPGETKAQPARRQPEVSTVQLNPKFMADTAKCLVLHTSRQTLTY
jgi:hypothetical protein